jgi:hypothetical protein
MVHQSGNEMVASSNVKFDKSERMIKGRPTSSKVGTIISLRMTEASIRNTAARTL